MNVPWQQVLGVTPKGGRLAIVTAFQPPGEAPLELAGYEPDILKAAVMVAINGIGSDGREAAASG